MTPVERPPQARLVSSLSEDELLAEVVHGRARRRGPEWERAKEAWRRLAALYHDRIYGLVVAFRFPDHPDIAIPPGEYGDVASEAWIRAVKMLDNFRGTTLAEFRAALRTCVTNTCMDECRKRMSREKGVAGSLDEPRQDDAGEEVGGRFDADVAARSVGREEARVAAREDLQGLAVAIEALRNPQAREVVRLRMTGHKSQEIAEVLGLTVNNVDQLFRRAMREIKEMSG